MTRIHEALRQAGLKTQTGVTEPLSAHLLEDFPVDGDKVVVPSAQGRLETEPLVDFPLDLEQDLDLAVPLKPELPRAAADTRNPAVLGRLVVHENVEPLAVEQYRQLGGTLHQAQVDRGTRIVMVVSAQPAEGKTLTAVNLALTLSESYHRKVLLIDADLRRPSLERLFQVNGAVGLSESLKAANRGPLQVVPLTERLALLPGGGADPDPMAGLTSPRMQQILQEAVATFDWVVLDTPPVALLPDTHLMVAMVDCAVLVISAGSTPCATVQRTIDRIGRAKIAGVVLNRVEKAALKEAKYYRYYSTAEAIGRQGLSEAGGIAR